MNEENLTEQQREYIKNVLGIAQPQTQDRMVNFKKKRALAKLKELNDNFDKDALTEMFDEGLAAGVFEGTFDLNLQFKYKGYLYILRRVKMSHVKRG